MAEGEGLKSRLELAMERLRKQDEEAGVDQQPLTDEQRNAIAEIRNFYEAKLAEIDIMVQGKLQATAWDPEARALVEEAYRHDRERLTSERDNKIEKVRRG